MLYCRVARGDLLGQPRKGAPTVEGVPIDGPVMHPICRRISDAFLAAVKITNAKLRDDWVWPAGTRELLEGSKEQRSAATPERCTRGALGSDMHQPTGTLSLGHPTIYKLTIVKDTTPTGNRIPCRDRTERPEAA